MFLFDVILKFYFITLMFQYKFGTKKGYFIRSRVKMKKPPEFKLRRLKIEMNRLQF